VARVVGAAGRPVASRFVLIGDGVRRVFQAGVAATMIFCLVFVAVGGWSRLLSEPERILVGPADVERVWEPLFFPFQWLNQSVALVLLICLIAAFVDRTAARIARRTTPRSEPAEPAPPAPSARGWITSVEIIPSPAPVVPEQSTMRLGPSAGLPAAGGTPSYGGFSPVTPTYTNQGQPAPSFGSAFGAPAGLTPPPAGPSAVPPTGLLSGLWDGEPDEPREPGVPRDDDRGWSGFGRQ
jgi:hypothetical protein